MKRKANDDSPFVPEVGAAVWSTHRGFGAPARPGTIESVGKTRCTVRWEDGSTSEVRTSQLRGRTRTKPRAVPARETHADTSSVVAVLADGDNRVERPLRAFARNEPVEIPLREMRAELRAQPKQVNERSSKHLAHVRAMPCAWCHAPGPSDPHHAFGVKGTGMKASDYHVVPLCRQHHDEFHARGSIGFMTPAQTKEWAKSNALAICAGRLARIDNGGEE